jgi:hypothetical protein
MPCPSATWGAETDALVVCMTETIRVLILTLEEVILEPLDPPGEQVVGRHVRAYLPILLAGVYRGPKSAAIMARMGTGTDVAPVRPWNLVPRFRSLIYSRILSQI